MPEEKQEEPSLGLDARLDKSVPTESAVGFLLAGDGSQPGRVFPLTRNTNIVGRSERADVRLVQPAVSAEHARIISGTLGFEIEDLGSVNGTYVNGVRITRSKLQRGDRLTLGNVEFTFLVEKTPDATMALLPPSARRTTTLATHRPVALAPMHGHGDDGGEMSLADAVRKAAATYSLLRPHFPLVIKLAVLGAGLGIGSAYALPPPDMAICETRLYPIKKANPVDGQTATASEGEQIQFFIDAERSFAMPGLVRSTLEKLDGKPPQDALIQKILPRIKLEVVGDKLYRATYKEPAWRGGEIPPVRFLDAHVKNYIQTDIERGLKAIDNEAKFLNEKLANAAADMSRINKDLAEFKKANADDLPETSEQAHSSRYYLDTRKGELAAQIAKLAGELAVDEAQMRDGNPLQQSKFQSSQVYRGSLQELKRRLSEAYARGLADGHPEVQQMKNEIGRLGKVIEQEMSSETSEADKVADPAFSGLKAKVGVGRSQLRAAQIELQEVERNLERVKRAVITIPAVAAKLDDLQRQYDSRKRLYDQLSDQAQKAGLQLDVERLGAQSRFEIVTPTFVLKPQMSRTIQLRGGLGLGIAIALAALIIGFIEIRKMLRRIMASEAVRG